MTKYKTNNKINWKLVITWTAIALIAGLVATQFVGCLVDPVSTTHPTFG